MKWTAEAPSNIALIKYIGKKESSLHDSGRNVPLNSSLSYTLHHLKTRVEINPAQKEEFVFQPLGKEEDLSSSSKKKFLNFFEYLKKTFFISGNYQIISQNNFPHSKGVASSASSFSALTQATYKLAKDRSKNFESFRLWNATQLSELSRQGSGSSCRSFFSPWALWSEKEVTELSHFSWSDLHHELILVPSSQKKISSTKAHERVKTSSAFKGRPQRAEKRLKTLMKAFEIQDWRATYNIVKEEFLDLHHLFQTSSPSFSYQTPETQQILKELFLIWDKGDGPLITMDAGPLIHLLYRPDQKDLAQKIRKRFASYSFLFKH